MSADTKFKVEVTILKTEWVEAYGVTEDDAMDYVRRHYKDMIPTGQVKWVHPEEDNDRP